MNENERFLVIIFFIGLMVLVVISTQFILNYVIKTEEDPYKIFGIVHGCIFGVFFILLTIGYGSLKIKKENSDAEHTQKLQEQLSDKDSMIIFDPKGEDSEYEQLMNKLQEQKVDFVIVQKVGKKKVYRIKNIKYICNGNGDSAYILEIE